MLDDSTLGTLVGDICFDTGLNYDEVRKSDLIDDNITLYNKYQNVTLSLHRK